MDQPNIGQLTTLESGRDAIHFAVIAYKAETFMQPGTRVFMNNKLIGIADPFLEHSIAKGEVFWLFLMPNTITSLKHTWTHPDFNNEVIKIEFAKAETDKDAAEAWLKAYCSDNYISWEDFLASLNNHYDNDDYFTIHGSDAHGEIPHEFWVNVNQFTGKKLSKPEYFSCSC